MAAIASRFRTMIQLTALFLLASGLTMFSGVCFGQNAKTITVRMLDSRTGVVIASEHYMVRMNHIKEEHGDWVKKNDSGSGDLTLPPNATEISIHATYEYATDYYMNCDTEGDKGTSEHVARLEHWYPVDKILSEGIVAPNGCVGKKVPEKLQVVARPGEFVFFVRQRRTIERFAGDSQ